MLPDELASQTREAIAEALDCLQVTTLLVEQLQTQVADAAERVRSLSNLLEEIVTSDRMT
ncbi:MAG TPA: hypothetical protein V6D18_10720 [Thermosynechococcaceae cyanobacterium]